MKSRELLSTSFKNESIIKIVAELISKSIYCLIISASLLIHLCFTSQEKQLFDVFGFILRISVNEVRQSQTSQ